MLEWLDKADKELFLFLNGMHNPFFDEVMWMVSNKFLWIPIYILLVYFMFKYYNQEGLVWLIGIIILVILTDQFTSTLLKPSFGRLRPCHDPEIMALVHNVKRCGGLYGFVSGHSANSFAIATFSFMIFYNKLRYIWLLFPWAVVIAYSRIYLGVHYPGDILIGAIIGIIFGLTLFHFTSKIYQKRKDKLSK